MTFFSFTGLARATSSFGTGRSLDGTYSSEHGERNEALSATRGMWVHMGGARDSYRDIKRWDAIAIRVLESCGHARTLFGTAVKVAWTTCSSATGK